MTFEQRPGQFQTPDAPAGAPDLRVAPDAAAGPPAGSRGTLPGPSAPRSTADRLLIGLALVVVAALLLSVAGLVVVRELRNPHPVALASPASTIPAVVSTAPSAPPTAPSSASPVEPSSAPSAAPSAGLTLAQQVAVIEAQVPPLRQLQPRASVPNRIVDQATAAAELQREYDAANPAASVAAVQALWQHLGLLPAETDLRALELQAQQSQVLGFYDDSTRTMTVIQGSGGFGPLEQMTLAHEYTHALQDQNFGLAKLQIDTPDQTDRDLARQALVEGDATVTMTAWAVAHLTPDQLQQVASSAGAPQSQAELAALPPILQSLLMFPYVDGATFVGQLLQQPGGWTAVDAAYRRPPNSTAQILHPELYLLHWQPVTLKLPDVAAELGAGWRMSDVDTLGELMMRVWLAQAVDSATATDAATGWAGDRIGGYQGPDGAWGVAWSTAWQNAADARRFESAADQMIRHLATGGRVAAVLRFPTVSGSGGAREAVLIASSQAILSRLERILAP